LPSFFSISDDAFLGEFKDYQGMFGMNFKDGSTTSEDNLEGYKISKLH
jgi:hypothetical protein